MGRHRLGTKQGAILQEIHAWGFCTIRHLCALRGISPSAAQRAVSRLRRDGLIASIGYALADPTTPDFGLYYASTGQKCPNLDLIWRMDSRVIPEDYYLRTSGEYRFRKHPLYALHTAEWLCTLALSVRLPYACIPEFLLRYKYGWYGKGSPPMGHSNPQLRSVPDMVFQCAGSEFHIEVELTIKRRARYEEHFSRMIPRKQPILFATDTHEKRDQLLDTLSGIDHPFSVHVIYEGEPSDVFRAAATTSLAR